MTTTILGFKLSMPIMIAPTAMQKMAHPEGEKHIFHQDLCHSTLYISLIMMLTPFLNAGEYATARAASAAGTIMVDFLTWLI